MGFYLGESDRPEDIARAKDYERLDGSHPGEGEIFREECPVCGTIVLGAIEMRRCFEEVE